MAAVEKSRRAFWIKQFILWHWVSSAICLGGMLLFTVTGITLNHAAEISAKPVVTQLQRELPVPLKIQIRSGPKDGKHPLPPQVGEWIAQQFGVTQRAEPAEWSEDEVYISLPKPGGDGWAVVERERGIAKYERTDRGWISYANDLHKGRNTGSAWVWFIDVLAVAFLVFTITGLLLLQVHAAKRATTWPIVGFGVALPVLLIVFLVHR